MPTFDQEFIETTGKRLENLSPDSAPLWGKMNCAQMMGHLNMTIIYSMGNLPAMPGNPGWMSRNIIGPLILNGILKLPKNFVPPRPEGAPEPPPPPEGNKQMLLDAMERYRLGLEAGTIKAAPHPGFGDIGAEGWAKMHVVHTDHHLRQFGI
jgi:hypothetical protein